MGLDKFVQKPVWAKQDDSGTGDAPKNRKTFDQVRKELGVKGNTLRDLIKNFVAIHGDEHYKKFKVKSSSKRPRFMSAELIKYIEQEVQQQRGESKPEGSLRMTTKDLMEKTNRNLGSVGAWLSTYYKKHSNDKPPVYFDSRVGHRCKFHSEEAARFVIQKAEEIDRYKQEKKLVLAPKDWLTITAIARDMKVLYKNAEDASNKFLIEKPDEKPIEYLDTTNSPRLHFSPSAVSRIKEILLEKSRELAQKATILVRKDYKTLHVLTNEFGNGARYQLDEISKIYEKENPSDSSYLQPNRHGYVTAHWSPAAIQYIREKYLEKRKEMETNRVPVGWHTDTQLKVELGLDSERVMELYNKYRELNPADQRREFYNSINKKVWYFSPAACAFIREERKNLRYYVKIDKESINNFFENSRELENFKQHISLFGAAQNLDILYALRPDFKDIPPERLKGMIAEYLGSYLLSPAPFDPNKIEGALVGLKNDSLREGLREVIRNDCLHAVLKVRKANPNISEKDLFDNYFLDLRKKCERYKNNPELEQTILEVEDYYYSVLEDFEKPGGRMVNELKESRKFPDLYQKINVKEISDKKRMLIADEMGVGKSASAILAKEELGVKTALIVAPQNVISTWQRYLSDTVEDGKQIGYFKPGLAPKVLIIESPEDAANISPEACDYILISQEKLSRNEYIEPLLRTDYDMLIADEVHEFKNVREGKRSQSIMELAEKIKGENQYLALLSGTPVPNKVEDVAILLKLLYPDKFADIETRHMVSSIIKGDLADLRTLLVPRMQMKSLAENVEMPKLIERTVRVPLSKAEEEIYQVLLDEDELTSVEKMHALRQFVVNPNLLNVTPGMPCSKLDALKNEVDDAFKKHDKVLVFVNDYIEDVIRGKRTIFENFTPSNEIKIETIHGGTTPSMREVIQKSFNSNPGKTLLFVSGSTAAVGVDYSGADHLIFYNEPWTKADKDQQRSRPYRPGLTHDLECVTLLAENTIDEGIHRYIETKFNAINKLLKGIPITEFEQNLITEAEKTKDKNQDLEKEVNADLARYYFSVFDKLNRMFASVKQIGEEKFQEWLVKNAEDYADAYDALGGRSYQANGSRVVAALVQEMAKEKRIDNPRVLDIGSGPEMLRKHSLEKYQSNVFSADINEAQFSKSTSGTAVVASYTSTPFATNAFDFVNMSLVLDHTQFIPSKNKFERVTALSEMARNLKIGGRGIINEVYSLDFEDREKLPEIATSLGLRVVEEFSGTIRSGEAYQSNVVTFEKIADPPDDPIQTIKDLPREVRDGLKFKKVQALLKDRRRIVTNFRIGSREIPIALNARDRMLHEAEQKILKEGETLKRTYGSIEAIPSGIVERGGFRRLGRAKYWILFKETDGSAIIVR